MQNTKAFILKSNNTFEGSIPRISISKSVDENTVEAIPDDGNSVDEIFVDGILVAGVSVEVRLRGENSVEAIPDDGNSVDEISVDEISVDGFSVEGPKQHGYYR